tara:strand:+ start:1362 stop:4895 length:3534 start_codon:yes stop_codon:yes gene_type:complete
LTFGEEVDDLVKTEAQLKGTSIKTAEARIAKRLGVAPSTVQGWRYRKHDGSFKPRSKTLRGVPVEKTVRRSYLRLQKQKVFHKLSRKPPTLHFVCSPGGGAFSVYIFLRYALAQRTEKSDVKMTMFCRKEKDGSFKAETWWNKWCQQHELRQKLGFPKGWRPVFLYSDSTCEFKQTQHDTYVYILAGGERAQLIDSYLNSYKSGKQTLLLAEEDLVKLENGSFVFNSVIAGGETSEPDFSGVDTDEALLAIETAIGPTFSSAITDGLEVILSGGEQKWTYTLGWKALFSLSDSDVSRLHVRLSPLFSGKQLKKPKNKSKKDVYAEYFKTHLNKFRDWKKSMRITLEGIPEGRKEQIEARVPDAKKILSDEAKDRSKFFPLSSFVFRSDKHLPTTMDEVYWLTWDPRNIGRSTQQLSLALSSLESNQSIVLTNFNVEENKSGDYISVFLSSLEKIQESRGDNIWSKGLKHISAQSILTNELISYVRKFDSIRISEVGLNGPSLKQILESVINIETLTAIKLTGKSYFLGEIPAKISFDQHHEAFARGVFSLGKKEYDGKEMTQNLRFERLHKSPFQQERIARYLIWLETPNSGKPGHSSPLPGNRWCTLDRNGQLIRVWDEFSNNTLEMLLYLSMECLRNLNGETNRLLLPEKNGREIKHTAYSQQDPELWGSTITQQGDIFHYFADAKALDKGTSREHLEEFSIESLFSKYAWETLEGPVPTVALSFFGTSPSSRQKVPYLYNWYDETEYPSLCELTRGIDLANFGNYLMKFMAKNPEEIGSYQNLMGKERLIVKFPRVTSPNFQPNKNQTHLEFFRENSENYLSSKSQRGESTSQAEDRTYAGVFYRNQHPLEAFHFYDEPIEQCATWALEVVGLQDFFSAEFETIDDSDAQNKALSFIRMDGTVNRKISVSEFLQLVDLQRLEKYLTSDDDLSTYADYKERTGLMNGWPEVKLAHITAVRRQELLEHVRRSITCVPAFKETSIVPKGKNKNPYFRYLEYTEGRASFSSWVKEDKEEVVRRLNEQMRSQSANLKLAIDMLNKLSPQVLNASDFEWRVKITDFEDDFNDFSTMVKKVQSSISDAMFAVHQMAENRPTRKKLPNSSEYKIHQTKLILLYNEAQTEMLKSGSTIKWGDFLTVFGNYSSDSIFSSSSEKRYLRYIQLKAKRSSQSSQSDV